MPVFSLIIPTLNRTLELKRLFESIRAQASPALPLSEIEVIVVDQNTDARLASLLREFQDLTIRHLRIECKGLAHAKNRGLKPVSGSIVAFPDDDCWLAPGLLEGIRREMEKCRFKEALLIRAEDPESHRPLLRYPTTTITVSQRNREKAFLGIQIGQFYPASLIRGLQFDERFGLGSATRWGSGEDTDFLLNFLANGHAAVFVPELLIFHPWVGHESMTSTKVTLYAAGFGALCAKHRMTPHCAYKVLLQLIKGAFGILSMNPRTITFSLLTAVHRIRGFLQYREH